HEIRHWEADGREPLYVSRVWTDRIGSGAPMGSDQPVPAAGTLEARYGDVVFRDGLEPFVPVALRETNADRAGLVTALLDLQFVADYIAQLRVGKAGYAYLTDARGTIIAYPNPDLMLRRRSVAEREEFRAA